MRNLRFTSGLAFQPFPDFPQFCFTSEAMLLTTEITREPMVVPVNRRLVFLRDICVDERVASRTLVPVLAFAFVKTLSFNERGTAARTIPEVTNNRFSLELFLLGFRSEGVSFLRGRGVARKHLKLGIGFNHM